MKNKHKPGRPSKRLNYNGQGILLGTGSHKVQLSDDQTHSFEEVNIFPNAAENIQHIIDCNGNTENTTVKKLVDSVLSQIEPELRRANIKARDMNGITPVIIRFGRTGKLITECTAMYVPPAVFVMAEDEYQEIMESVGKDVDAVAVSNGDFQAMKKRFKKEVKKSASVDEQFQWWKDRAG